MKCPDCGTRLSDVQVDGQFLYRCYKCGGFWGDGLAFSKIIGHDLAAMRRVKIDPSWLKGGTGVCPLDGLPLSRYISSEIPDTIEVKRCVRCGKQWYGSDSLFEHKLSAGAVVMSRPNVPRVLFVAVLAVFLVGGLISALVLVSRPQTKQTHASNLPGVNLQAKKLEDGSMQVRFEAVTAMNSVKFRVYGEEEWQELPVNGLADGRYEVVFWPQDGKVYEFLIGDNVYLVKN